MIEKFFFRLEELVRLLKTKKLCYFQVGGDLSDSQMEITTKDQKLADFKEIISIEYEGALEVAFRISYLYDVINAIPMSVKLAVIWILVWSEHINFNRFIVMPMRANTYFVLCK